MSHQDEILQTPTAAYESSRRRFLKGVFGGLALVATGSSDLLAKTAANPLLAMAPPSGTPDESYWRLVKDQFGLKKDLILMNAANLCPAPFPVVDAVINQTRDLDRDASFQNRAKLGTMRESALNSLAGYCGCESSEIVITRNTTESNNIVINGLDLGRGDEVILWDENHPSNNIAWDVRAQRFGFTVKRIAIPANPRDSDALFQVFADALSARTKILAFSHISNGSGVQLPVKSLCQLARERNILTLVDGAQSFGFQALDLHDLGCDFYTASAHKWLMGPKEAGILYVRDGQAAQLWPSIVGLGWDRAKSAGAARFSTLGQRDDATVVAMQSAVAFHQAIGRERIEKRILDLAFALRQAVQRAFPQSRMTTPGDPQLAGGVLVFEIPGLDSRKAFTALYENHLIGCAARGSGLRFCPHIYNLMSEVDKVAWALQKMV